LTYLDQGFSPKFDEFFWTELGHPEPDPYEAVFDFLLEKREPISVGEDLFQYCTLVFPKERRVHCWMNFYDCLPIGSTLVLAEDQFQLVSEGVYVVFPDEA
jgi:hypothetical protein